MLNEQLQFTLCARRKHMQSKNTTTQQTIRVSEYTRQSARTLRSAVHALCTYTGHTPSVKRQRAHNSIFERQERRTTLLYKIQNSFSLTPGVIIFILKFETNQNPLSF